MKRNNQKVNFSIFLNSRFCTFVLRQYIVIFVVVIFNIGSTSSCFGFSSPEGTQNLFSSVILISSINNKDRVENIRGSRDVLFCPRVYQKQTGILLRSCLIFFYLYFPCVTKIRLNALINYQLFYTYCELLRIDNDCETVRKSALKKFLEDCSYDIEHYHPPPKTTEKFDR